MKLFEFREFYKKSETDKDLVLEFWEDFISRKYPSDISWNSDKLRTVPDIKFEYLKKDIDKIIENLEIRSGRFLSDLKDGNTETEYFKFLWRGISKMGDPIQSIYSSIPFESKIINNKINLTIKSTRKDRHPVDTPNEIHSQLDNLFQDKFGYRLRSESVFTFPDKDLNRSYGDPWMIFPIGEYEVYWSHEISDLYNYLDDIYITIDQKNLPISNCDLWMNDQHVKSEAIELLTKITNKYIKGNLDEILENPFMGYDLKEVMIRCDQYCLVHEVFDIPLSFYLRGEINKFFEILKEISE